MYSSILSNYRQSCVFTRLEVGHTSTIKEMEHIVNDYEKRIEKLKQLEKEINRLNTDGFEKEISEIKKLIKDPRSLEQVEKEIKNLKIKIDETVNKNEEREKKKKESERETPKRDQNFQSYFPYELTPYYEKVGLIGKGGFARVFRANRKKDNMEVAVKVPISMDRAIGKSFVKELENWTKLRHQNIVEIFDYNVLPIPYIEMELCDSCLETLEKPMKVEEALWVVFNIAEGLKYAHKKKIAHLDIKPHNILLKQGIPKISDWGLSKLTAESKTSTMAAFSPIYAAPEHISPQKFGIKDERTDIWQLGIILYELATGKLPFEGNDIMELGFKIVNEDCMLPSECNKEALKVDGIIKKCLQRDKEKRYKNMDDLQRDIAYILNIECKNSLKESQSVNNLSKSAYFCGELLLVNMKIGEKKDAYKYATDMLKYVQENIKNDLGNLVKELEERIENNLDINEKLVEKADIIVHKIRIRD